MTHNYHWRVPAQHKVGDHSHIPHTTTPLGSPSDPGIESRIWKEGEIAYLKPYHAFVHEDFNSLIASGYLQYKATNHPVIVLHHCPNRRRSIVTTVSAYSSGPHNGFLPPWRQHWHQWKERDDFRSIEGCELANGRPALALQGGLRMPKPESSWIYIQSVFVVPNRVLAAYNKSPHRLVLEPGSLADLRAHMTQRSWDYYQCLRTLNCYSRAGSVAHDPFAAAGPLGAVRSWLADYAIGFISCGGVAPVHHRYGSWLDSSSQGLRLSVYAADSPPLGAAGVLPGSWKGLAGDNNMGSRACAFF